MQRMVLRISNLQGVSKTPTKEIEHHGTSGTSAEPNSTPVSMLITDWTLMFHGVAFRNVLQQSGPDGAAFEPIGNAHALRQLGPSMLTLRTILSFEPATRTARYYPELFQQGETAFGKPIVHGSIRMTSSWNWQRSS